MASRDNVNPTPGTCQSILKHGFMRDEQLCLLAVCDGSKPAALINLNWPWMKYEGGEGLLIYDCEGESDSIVVIDSPEGRRNAKRVMEALGKTGDDKRRSLGKALGYYEEEIEEFIQRTHALSELDSLSQQVPCHEGGPSLSWSPSKP